MSQNEDALRRPERVELEYLRALLRSKTANLQSETVTTTESQMDALSPSDHQKQSATKLASHKDSPLAAPCPTPSYNVTSEQWTTLSWVPEETEYPTDWGMASVNQNVAEPLDLSSHKLHAHQVQPLQENVKSPALDGRHIFPQRGVGPQSHDEEASSAGRHVVLSKTTYENTTSGQSEHSNEGSSDITSSHQSSSMTVIIENTGSDKPLADIHDLRSLEEAMETSTNPDNMQIDRSQEEDLVCISPDASPVKGLSNRFPGIQEKRPLSYPTSSDSSCPSPDLVIYVDTVKECKRQVKVVSESASGEVDTKKDSIIENEATGGPSARQCHLLGTSIGRRMSRRDNFSEAAKSKDHKRIIDASQGIRRKTLLNRQVKRCKPWHKGSENTIHLRPPVTRRRQSPIRIPGEPVAGQGVLKKSLLDSQGKRCKYKGRDNTIDLGHPSTRRPSPIRAPEEPVAGQGIMRKTLLGNKGKRYKYEGRDNTTNLGHPVAVTRRRPSPIRTPEEKPVTSVKEKYRYYSQNCPLCPGLELSFSLDRHAMRTHLPYFVNPEAACWDCKIDRNYNSCLLLHLRDPEHPQCAWISNPELVQEYHAKGMKSLHQTLCEMLSIHPSNAEALIKYGVENKLWSHSMNTLSPASLVYLMQNLEKRQLQQIKDISVDI